MAAIIKYFDIFELNNTYNYNAKRSKLRIFHSYKSAAQDSEANDESRGNNDHSLIHELMLKKRQVDKGSKSRTDPHKTRAHLFK